MITISQIALQKLTSYLHENNVSSPVRIAPVPAGCSGVSLGLAVDDVKDTDIVQSCGELTLLVEKTLLDQCGSISLDFIEKGSRSGFSITSVHPIPGGNVGCKPGSCGTGGCGC